MLVHISTGQTVVRLLVAFGLTYVIGFERELRGSPAGNRTFALVGIGGGICGLFAVEHNGPTAFSGVITGVGFIGAAVAAHVAGNDGGIVRGLTTATTIVGAAAVGSVSGAGDLTIAGISTALILLTLELRWCPGLRWIDANIWNARVRSETRNGGLTQHPFDGDPQDICAVHPPIALTCTCSDPVRAGQSGAVTLAVGIVDGTHGVAPLQQAATAAGNGAAAASTAQQANTPDQGSSTG